MYYIQELGVTFPYREGLALADVDDVYILGGSNGMVWTKILLPASGKFISSTVKRNTDHVSYYIVQDGSVFHFSIIMFLVMRENVFKTEYLKNTPEYMSIPKIHLITPKILHSTYKIHLSTVKILQSTSKLHRCTHKIQ